MAEKVQIRMKNGELVQAQNPVIISASRSTDIPAFYADWFFDRLKKGYSAWTNPFNGVRSYISYEYTRFIVFWSKNPRPLIPHLAYLKERKIGCYIQYTLNDYVDDGLEKAVPSVDYRIDIFKELVNILGKGHIIWRFDPLILTDRISIDDLIRKIEYIGDKLHGYTEKLIFSFVDISLYKKVENNLKKGGIAYQEWTTDSMNEFSEKLSELNKKWGYTLATCGEKIDMQKYGIVHNKCIDDDLIIRLAYNDEKLMQHLGVSIEEGGLFGDIPEGGIEVAPDLYAVKKRNTKDKGQREFCGCIPSKDIGEYNTCIHKCEYCYANSSKELASKNYQRHKLSPESETIIGL